MSTFYIKKWSAWSPGLESEDQWEDWSNGLIELNCTKDTPSLKHLPPISRRRLSQLTKMVLHVGHELNNSESQLTSIFCSQYGEITQQNKISRKLIDSGEVSPSSFSLSVFNTPVSLLSIHEKNMEPATVQLSGKRILVMGFLSLIAELEATPEKNVLVIFADEYLPNDYDSLTKEDTFPYAFGFLIGRKKNDSSISLEIEIENDSEIINDNILPLDFLKWLLKDKKQFQLNGCGVQLKISRSC